MKKLVLVAALSLMVSGVSAETVNLKTSTITWSASKITGSLHSGPIKIKKAKLKNGKGELVIDMNSIDESELTGKMKKKFLSHIKSKDFFVVDKYPTAKIKIEKLDSGYLYGKLTIKNKTNDVSIPYTKKGNSYSGEFAFDRTKFDMVYGSGNFFKNLGDKVINDTVKIKFNIVVK